MSRQEIIELISIEEKMMEVYKQVGNKRLYRKCYAKAKELRSKLNR